MADVYLFAAEPNPGDVRLREPAAETLAPIMLGSVWEPGRPHRPARPYYRPLPAAYEGTVAVTCQTRPRMALTVDHGGRRRHEDELVLTGAL